MQSKPRTVIVTGANKGIGYHTIETLFASQTPYHLILAARSQANGEEAVNKLKAAHPNASNKVTFRQLDIDDSNSIQAFADWVRSDLGTFDVLVDNAAIWNVDTKEKQKQIDVVKTNTINTIEFTEKLLPYLSDDGKVIVITSTVGSFGFQSKKARAVLEDPALTPKKLLETSRRLVESIEKGEPEDVVGFYNSAYHASKALMNAYVRILPKFLKPGQQAYAVCPGWCQTDMGGSDAPLSAEQGAETPVWLINLPFKVDPNLNGKFIRDKEVIPYDFVKDVPEFLAKVIDF